MVTCGQSTKEIAGDECTLVKLTGLYSENFSTWDKTDTAGYDKHAYLSRDKCFVFERDLWFELGKFMWSKHQSVYQDHMKYICNDIVNTFKVKILCYTDHVHEMHYLDKYLPPSLMKGESAEADNWTNHNQ